MPRTKVRSAIAITPSEHPGAAQRRNEPALLRADDDDAGRWTGTTFEQEHDSGGKHDGDHDEFSQDESSRLLFIPLCSRGERQSYC